MSRFRNIFECIEQNGDDQGFIPRRTVQFQPTDSPAGSPAKLEELRRRLELGLPLWHPKDRKDFDDWWESADSEA